MVLRGSASQVLHAIAMNGSGGSRPSARSRARAAKARRRLAVGGALTRLRALARLSGTQNRRKFPETSPVCGCKPGRVRLVDVPFVSAPEGQELPFVADRLHSVKGKRVPQRMLYPSQCAAGGRNCRFAARAEPPLSAVRRSMAVRYGAETTCPVTTQRLLRDIAAAAVKAWESGDRAVTPFWRVVDPDTPTARLMAGGAAFIRARRAEESV